MFIGRESELAKLNRLYKADKFQCVIIYGRRRVGKTALISEFVKDKKNIFFIGEETTATENLENLSRSIFVYVNENAPSPVFSSYREAFEQIYQMSQKEKLVLIID